ncbi:IS481 family transposase [Glycomyces luteolus]|uniref:IS481 family transposase n=1 Tax=Glycomyces luteolus TaxID=2670330 RepID=A0A9X3PLL7_9ACTN|nr:IS481 family transposase [Glycomyces luteolus]MDA1360890.1 IS481 family transposase [Glycomyces luteolus]
MSKARLVITAVILEGRSQTEVAHEYGVSKGWVSKLVARYRAEGAAAFEPRSRRPKTSPTAIGTDVVGLIAELREKLSTAGLDAGPDTIAWHLAHHHKTTVSAATISRYLTKAGLVEPAPRKRPRSTYIRFEAAMPNECWQADFTHYRLADGADTEILTWLDDCTRYALSVTAHERVTGPITQGTFQAAYEAHGVPASTLTDNGLVFTTRLAGGRGGKNALEHELARLGVTQKNSRPNRPTTCGKVERFQQTMKKHLAAANPQPATLADLQALIDAFTETYNHHRPHRSLPHRATPAAVYTTRPRATPAPTSRPPTPAGSAPTPSTKPDPSPCATTENSTTSASAEPTKEPASS